MLTFEEFSAKKKIDLTLFQKAEPVLYSEFRTEYDQMGEKSFDHSKKFWFNKLRRAYHLQVEPKPPKEIIEKSELSSQVEPISSADIGHKPSYTPGFNMKNIKPASEE